MKRNLTTMAIALSLGVSGTALADQLTIKNLPSTGAISVTGTVDSVTNERSFVLRDATGKIHVDLVSSDSVVLTPGQTVTVEGAMDKGILTTDINATNVAVHQSVGTVVKDSIEGSTKISFENAKAFDIKSLPTSGLVKISGTVTDIDSEKEFTISDRTGEIDINVASDQNAILTNGAEVTVIGFVDSGFTGKDINAKKVLVTSNAPTR